MQQLLNNGGVGMGGRGGGGRQGATGPPIIKFNS